MKTILIEQVVNGFIVRPSVLDTSNCNREARYVARTMEELQALLPQVMTEHRVAPVCVTEDKPLQEYWDKGNKPAEVGPTKDDF